MPAAEVAAQGSGPAASRAGTIELGGEVSAVRLGFGAMRLPGVWGAPNDPQQARRLLRRVIELGVNVIDTAHAYGPEVSERLIAEALHPYPQELIVATKGGYGRRGPHRWAADGRPETIRRHCQRSLELLRLERIDLLQLHTVDPAVPIEESVGAIVDLQGEGKVRMIGVSNVSVEELERARAVGEIASVQNRYNLGDRESEDVLAVCEGAGIAFLPWFPLGSGALAGAGELQAVASAHGATAAQVAIAWLLQRSPVLLPIPGTASIAHLEENTAAAGLRLSAEEFGRLSTLVGHPRA
ncbi:MAG TPA: aldo/keto reductase [Actinomycetota bacterium]|nr:aldo/keto reductase [Actinomycetota bacterium]